MRRHLSDGHTLTVCQVLHSLDVGGAEILASRLAHGLSSRFRMIFACLDRVGSLGESLNRDGWHVCSLNRNPGFDARCSYRLRKLIRSESIDILHAHQYTPFLYALMARIGLRELPILFTEHGRHQPDFPRRKRIWANRILIQRRDRIVGVGEAVRQALVQNEGLPESRVEVIFNGVDSDALVKASDREQARRELRAHADVFLIVQVARLDYLKDHLTALRALKRVSSNHAAVRLILIGEGPEKPVIRHAVDELKLNDCVTFLGTQANIGYWLSAADLFLLTSRSEGIPLTILEAMAAGLPVVATAVGGVGEIVQSGQTGMLAPAGDDERIAEAIGRVIGDTELRRQLGLAGQQRVREQFDAARMIEEYAGIYEALGNA